MKVRVVAALVAVLVLGSGCSGAENEPPTAGLSPLQRRVEALEVGRSSAGVALSVSLDTDYSYLDAQLAAQTLRALGTEPVVPAPGGVPSVTPALEAQAKALPGSPVGAATLLAVVESAGPADAVVKQRIGALADQRVRVLTARGRLTQDDAVTLTLLLLAGSGAGSDAGATTGTSGAQTESCARPVVVEADAALRKALTAVAGSWTSCLRWRGLPRSTSDAAVAGTDGATLVRLVTAMGSAEEPNLETGVRAVAPALLGAPPEDVEVAPAAAALVAGACGRECFDPERLPSVVGRLQLRVATWNSGAAAVQEEGFDQYVDNALVGALGYPAGHPLHALPRYSSADWPTAPGSSTEAAGAVVSRLSAPTWTRVEDLPTAVVERSAVEMGLKGALYQRFQSCKQVSDLVREHPVDLAPFTGGVGLPPTVRVRLALDITMLRACHLRHDETAAARVEKRLLAGPGLTDVTPAEDRNPFETWASLSAACLLQGPGGATYAARLPAARSAADAYLSALAGPEFPRAFTSQQAFGALNVRNMSGTSCGVQWWSAVGGRS